MMGHLGSGQDKLFYSFNLDNHIPREHLLRGIDYFLDLRELRQHLAPFYSPMGRPSIDPELMIRMLIVGYCFGIRSERRLCEEVHLNLAYRWFCRLGLDDAVPEHSTLSKNRHDRFRDSAALRHVFETVLSRCMSEGLVEGEGFAIDASIIRADASAARGVPGTERVDWGCAEGQSRAVREYLDALDEANPAGAEAAEADRSAPQKKISLTDPAASWTAAGCCVNKRSDQITLSIGCYAHRPTHAAFTTSLNPLPAVNLTVFAAGIVMVSPVDGLRPVRSARAPVENEPNPISWTVSPRVTAAVTASRMASMASPVLTLLSPVVDATASISSCLFIFQSPFEQ